MKTRLAPILALLLAACPLKAELAHRGSPVDLSDHAGLRLNPALAAWQPLAWEADWSWLHTGLLDSPAAIGQGGFSLSLPRWNTALLASHRDTDLLSETEIALDWAFRPLPNLSVGLEGGLRRFGWNRDRLSPATPDDPVFRNGYDRIDPVAGAGVFWSPQAGLRAGLGLKHLNRPRLSLEDDGPRAPIRAYAGVAWQGERLSLGLGTDNLDYVRGDGGAAGSLVGLGADWSPSMSAGWNLRDDFRLDGFLREDGLTLGLAASWLRAHWLRYEFTLPLGGLAEATDGTHRLAYRLDLGGALVPRSGADGRVIALPSRRLVSGTCLDFFARLWRGDRAPVLLRPRSRQVEVVELHVDFDAELAARLAELEMDPARLATAGLSSDGPRTLPGQDPVRETYSMAWWRLAGRIERMAREQGVAPVIHSGGRDLRLQELANLVGAPLQQGSDGGAALPDGAVVVPDTLRVDCLLPEELAELVADWTLRLVDAAGTAVGTGAAGAPPALLSLPLAGADLEAGEATLTLTARDGRGREFLARDLPIWIQRRARHAALRLKADDAPLPERIDGLHLHLGDDE